MDSHAERGLDESEVPRLQEAYGLNEVTAKQGHGPLVRFLLQFHQPLIYILLVAAVITGALGEWLDCAVILAVVLINALVGFVQESKALQAIGALAKTVMTEATVIRGGRKQRIASREIVPGDLVLLQSGDKVPADLRLTQVRDLQVAEAALTGESVPVEKTAEPLDLDTVLGDRRNMAYASTLVTYGQGRGVAVATGDRTEVGRISQLISAADELQTPLTRRIARFSHLLVVVIVVLAAVNFAIGVVRGQTAFDMFLASVALAVAAIPEGLPAAVTITLAIGVARMARRRAIIRRLPAVETLGSTTVVCSDKTGTLTENQMTVTTLVVQGESYSVTGVGYAPEGDFRASGDAGHDDPPAEGRTLTQDELERDGVLRECLRAGVLCNDSVLAEEEGRWNVQGDPTEGALLVAGAKAGIDASALLAELPRVDAIPFESEHQYMATLHDAGADRARLVYLKGAVEAVLQRCADADGAEGKQAHWDKDAVHQQVRQLASRGLRVLAFARGEMPAGTNRLGHEDVASGLTFLGLQAMIDPPRAEAVSAVSVCQKAGMRVKMITGDHALTAAAIARELGLRAAGDDSSADVPTMTGRELAELSDEQLIEAADRTPVFARVAPEQKLRLVRALQAREHVVAMTGDGVNDAPALKQADIGVAMGITGTDVAKESADMVLTDDNFASIEAAVEEGRGVFDNLTKFIVWTLPTNGGEALVILAAVLLGTALPILPVQILWINMTTAVLLGLMLAFEPKEPGIMLRPPRDPRAPLLSASILLRIALVSLLLFVGAFGLFEWMLRFGAASLEQARTAAVHVLVMGELFYLFNCRSLKYSMFRLGPFRNRAVLLGVAAMLLLQLLLIYTPLMNRLFHTEPLGGGVWGLILVFGTLLYCIVEVEKWAWRRYGGAREP